MPINKTISGKRAGGIQHKTIGIKGLLARIAIIVLLMELFIMLAFDVFPRNINLAANAALNTGLLAAISIPIIYFWAIRPFVVARDAAEERIVFMAFHDSLTELPNRRLLLEYLEKYLAVCERHPVFGALIFVDIDDFKKINDAYGHFAGDTVLVEIARRLKLATRAEDTLSRLGGDEFVILVQQLDRDESIARNKAASIAEKIHHALKEPIYHEGTQLKLGISIGIQLIGNKKMSAKMTLNQADKAMYSAKQERGGEIVFLDG